MNYSKNRVSSRPNKTGGLMETVSPCTDMHRLKPDKIPALKKGSGPKDSSLTRKLFEIDASLEGENPFLQGRGTGC